MNISLDFDGVLNKYKRGDFDKPVAVIKPVNGAAEFIRECLDHQDNVFITSCRADTHAGVGDIEHYLYYVLGLTHTEVNAILISHHKPKCDIYIDDHGFRFEGKFPTRAELRRLAKTWLEK